MCNFKTTFIIFFGSLLPLQELKKYTSAAPTAFTRNICVSTSGDSPNFSTNSRPTPTLLIAKPMFKGANSERSLLKSPSKKSKRKVVILHPEKLFSLKN